MVTFSLHKCHLRRQHHGFLSSMTVLHGKVPLMVEHVFLSLQIQLSIHGWEDNDRLYIPFKGKL